MISTRALAAFVIAGALAAAGAMAQEDVRPLVPLTPSATPAAAPDPEPRFTISRQGESYVRLDRAGATSLCAETDRIWRCTPMEETPAQAAAAVTEAAATTTAAIAANGADAARLAADLQTRIDALGARVDALAAELAGNLTALGQDARIAAVDTADRLDTLAGNIEAMTAGIAANGEKLAANAAGLDGLGGRLDAMVARVDALGAQVTGVAAAVAELRAPPPTPAPTAPAAEIDDSLGVRMMQRLYAMVGDIKRGD